MKRLALIVFLALASAHAARADASLLVGSAASTLGTQAAADLIRTPSFGLGVFASRWDSQDHGRLTGCGIRLGGTLYRQLGFEARASTLESEIDSRKTSLIPLEAALTWRFRLGPHLVPYLGVGVGYYLEDAEYDDTESWNDSEKVAGYFSLAGVNLALGRISLFAEAKYNLVGTDEHLHWRGSGVDAENSLDGPSFNAGLKLGF